MDIDRLQRWLSLFANLAIIGGIFFLAMEIRQNQAALNSQAYQARAFDAIGANWNFISNPELRLLIDQFESGEIDIESLSPTQLSMLQSYYWIRRSDSDNEHYQYQNGFLDSDFYHTTSVSEIRKFAPYWRMFGVPEPRQRFTDEVNRILAEP